MRSIYKLIIFAVITSSTLAWGSPESNVLQKLKTNYPGVSFMAVKTTPSPKIYEVQIGKKVMYTDEGGNYFFPTMIEMKTKRNLGDERNEDLARIDFNSLPLGDAIKTVKGNGKRTIAIFSDVDCPYCSKLEQTMQGVTDITIYTFLLPLDQLHPQARDKSISIWCSSDKSAAWENAMKTKLIPKEDVCANPIERNVQLAKKLNIYGTPAMIFRDGRIIPGAAELPQIDSYLKKAG